MVEQGKIDGSAVKLIKIDAEGMDIKVFEEFGSLKPSLKP